MFSSLATSHVIGLRKTLEDIGEREAMVILCDNKLAIDIVKNPIYHNRTRHIVIKYHFIRDAIDNDEIELKFFKTRNQVANIFTKSLPKDE